MHSIQPLKDAFTQWANLKQVLLSLFGAVAGQGVVSYTGQFYALFYLQNILRVNARTTNILVAIALLIGAPLFPLFGALSDRIGRKKIIMAGLLLAVFTLIPIYKGMQQAAGNNVVAVSSVRDRVTGDIHLTPLTREEATGRLVPAPEASGVNAPAIVLLVLFQVVLACFVYGPIAAYLVEAFPAKVRYTSISLPYHIGNGIFGGILPFLGLLVCAATGNIYAGLYYPIAVAGITFVVGSLLLRETRGTQLWKEVATPATETAR
jgi:MFS family permease